MNVLIVGGGGREHALAWHLAQSEECRKIYAAPGNGGIAEMAECVPLSPTDLPGLVKFARDQRIGLTVVGPEEALAAGIADAFRVAGLPLFGPNEKSARLEASKIYAKELMKRQGIPTSPFMVFTHREQARYYARRINGPMVIKADGLAAGKGVFVCAGLPEAEQAIDALMKEGTLGDAGRRLIIEEVLNGEEASVMAVSDGRNLLVLPPCQDYKRARDGNQGPNTGGMGAICPTPVVTDKIMKVVERDVLLPTIHALSHQGNPFKGVLYAGLMVTDKGPYVLEFNVRFGDPETQPLLHRMRGNLLPLLYAVATGRMKEDAAALEVDPRHALCVVLASGGYPGPYEKGKVIAGLDSLRHPDIQVFHAGTVRHGDRLVTNGGRVLSVSALGKDLEEARARAYRAADRIAFEGCHFRRDIGVPPVRKHPSEELIEHHTQRAGEYATLSGGVALSGTVRTAEATGTAAGTPAESAPAPASTSYASPVLPVASQPEAGVVFTAPEPAPLPGKNVPPVAAPDPCPPEASAPSPPDIVATTPAARPAKRAARVVAPRPAKSPARRIPGSPVKKTAKKEKETAKKAKKTAPATARKATPLASPRAAPKRRAPAFRRKLSGKAS